MTTNSKCEIDNCPRNELGECELAKLDKKQDEYIEPSKCSHRLWKIKLDEKNKK